jgi:hypothetical protein
MSYEEANQQPTLDDAATNELNRDVVPSYVKSEHELAADATRRALLAQFGPEILPRGEGQPDQGPTAGQPDHS